jgi:glycosyltransferase A (GT-A) superfamily protein (DUF2064 family)
MKSLSLIIPVGLGDQSWNDLYFHFVKTKPDCEIIFIGPDFQNKVEKQFKFYHCEQGRAKQQNYGAYYASGEYIIFLHCDSVLNDKFFSAVQKKISSSFSGIAYFDLIFKTDQNSLILLNEIGVYLRSHIFKMPFGDQGLFMRKDLFFSLGLFSEKATYGEDHLFIWKAKRERVAIVPMECTIKTSDRKYIKNGWLKTTLSHLHLTYLQAAIAFKNNFFNKQKKIAIVAFVKTPNLSPVKTRLAGAIGAENALIFYQQSIAATRAYLFTMLRHFSDEIEIFWAVAEGEGLKEEVWSHFTKVSQGDGTLGERLHRVYAKLINRYRHVVLIGSDLPHVDVSLMISNIDKIKNSNSYVMGRALDGGFYLFSGSAPIDKQIWTSVEYSQTTTANSLINKIGKDHFIFLDELEDIDTIESLKKMTKEELTHKLPEQLEIINWSANLILTLNL